MRLRPVPTLAVVFYVVMTLALIYPGYLPFNRVRPFVLGMPFSLFWQVLWLLAAIVVLTLLFLWERSRRETG